MANGLFILRSPKKNDGILQPWPVPKTSLVSLMAVQNLSNKTKIQQLGLWIQIGALKAIFIEVEFGTQIAVLIPVKKHIYQAWKSQLQILSLAVLSHQSAEHTRRSYHFSPSTAPQKPVILKPHHQSLYTPLPLSDSSSPKVPADYLSPGVYKHRLVLMNG